MREEKEGDGLSNRERGGVGEIGIEEREKRRTRKRGEERMRDIDTDKHNNGE